MVKRLELCKCTGIQLSSVQPERNLIWTCGDVLLLILPMLAWEGVVQWGHCIKSDEVIVMGRGPVYNCVHVFIVQHLSGDCTQV